MVLQPQIILIAYEKKNKADYIADFTFHELFLECNSYDKRGKTTKTYIFISIDPLRGVKFPNKCLPTS